MRGKGKVTLNPLHDSSDESVSAALGILEERRNEIFIELQKVQNEAEFQSDALKMLCEMFEGAELVFALFMFGRFVEADYAKVFQLANLLNIPVGLGPKVAEFSLVSGIPLSELKGLLNNV